MTLTAKQQAFIQEYLVDLNATQAAIRAGYSKRTARYIGAENLTKPVIAAAIALAKAKRAEAVGITAEEVIRGLRKEAERTDDGSSHSARVAAWGHLAKAAGITDKHDHSVKGEIIVRAWTKEDDDNDENVG